MNRTLVDYNGRTNYNVGDIIPERILSQLTRSAITDVENTKAVFSNGIQIYRKDGEERGSHIVGWSLACQTHFYIVDDEGKILFSSGSYTAHARADGDCEFYNELKDFIDNGWQGPESEVLLNDDEDLNDTSIVLRLKYGTTSFLFTGDASSTIEKNILNKEIQSDVLKLGHHGSRYSTSKEFLKKVSPTYAIISVGKNNSYNHPHSEVFKRLNEQNVKIYRTDEQGTIIAESNGTIINFTTIKTNTNG